MIHKEKLDSLCHVNSGGTPSRGVTEYYGGKIPWAKIGDIEKSNGIIYETEEYITEAGLASIGNRIFPKDTLLFAMYGSVGKVAFCGTELSTNQAILGIRLKPEAKEKLDLNYLKYWFQVNLLFFKSRAVGGILKNLSATIVKDFDIPLPSINDQKRIAKILSQCEDLIQKRKESINLLDELLKSTFLEMFGDPVRNEKNWEVIPMEEAILSIDSGVSYGGIEKKELEKDELGVLKISAVTTGVFNPEEFKAVKKNVINKKITPVTKGMILISRANTKELVAACCIVPENYEYLFLPDKLWSITLNQNKIQAIFFNYLLKNENYRNLIRKKASGGHDSMLNISMQKFRTLTLIKPENQLDFVNVVNKIDSIKSLYIISLKELENLYGSISQKAFNGELDLSKVDISDMEDSKKKDNEEVKAEVEPIGEEFWDGNYKVQKFEVNIDQIIKKDFATTTFTFDKLVDAISEREVYVPYENIKRNIFELLDGEDALIEQVFDEETKTIAFKLK